MKIINIKSNLNILLSSHNSCLDFGKYPCTDDQVWFVLVLMFHWNWVRDAQAHVWWWCFPQSQKSVNLFFTTVVVSCIKKLWKLLFFELYQTEVKIQANRKWGVETWHWEWPVVLVHEIYSAMLKCSQVYLME